MKEFFSKAKNKVTGIASRCKREAVALTAVAASAMPMSVSAGATGGALMGKILDVITTIFTYIGILLLAWSIGMLVLAFKNEDADSKSRAMMLLVVSVVLIGIDGILSLVGVRDLI
jgi:hypothetical protein